MNPSNLSAQSGDLNWFIGVVENRNDPAKLGRVQVRIAGYHVHDLGILPTESLPWAQILMPPFGPMDGIGHSPTGIVEGAWVAGFFIDGTDAQFPVIWGVLPGIPSQARDPNTGFNDTRQSASGFPKPVTSVTKPGSFSEGSTRLYPDTLNQPDTSSFARNENVNDLKSGMLKTGVITPTGTWSEPSNPYAASYPFNHTFQTESGHLFEFDDTPGAERINLWHRSGAFTEFHPNGKKVNKSADEFNLIYGDQNTWAQGNLYQTAEMVIGIKALTIQAMATTAITLTAPAINLAAPVITFGPGAPASASGGVLDAVGYSVNNGAFVGIDTTITVGATTWHFKKGIVYAVT